MCFTTENSRTASTRTSQMISSDLCLLQLFFFSFPARHFGKGPKKTNQDHLLRKTRGVLLCWQE